jgi:heme-degrading monooxygenase HmoA
VIARVWKGRTAPEHAEAYGDFLRRTAYPDYGHVPGNRGWILLRRDDAGAVEFTLVSFWDSMDSVRRYAGVDAAQPKYYAEDRKYLLELPAAAEHLEVVDAPLRF